MSSAIADGTQPALSVITICFRNPDDLRETLATLNGLPSTVEVVVIDGSPDDRCANVAAEFPGVSHFQQPDDGKYDAMNKGASKARGKALLFLNSGDALISIATLAHLLDAHAHQLGDIIIFGDCKHRSGGRDVLVPAPPLTVENLRLGRLPSHQATIIPTRYQRENPYDATKFFTADTQFLKRAYRDLPAVHFREAISIFSHGGASTSPGNVTLLLKQYRELSHTHELSALERLSIALLLVRRKLLHVAIGEQWLQRLQAFRLAARNRSRR